MNQSFACGLFVESLQDCVEHVSPAGKLLLSPTYVTYRKKMLITFFCSFCKTTPNVTQTNISTMRASHNSLELHFISSKSLLFLNIALKTGFMFVHTTVITVATGNDVSLAADIRTWLFR